MLAAFHNAIYSPKVGKSAPGTTRHGIRLHDRLQSLSARTEFSERTARWSTAN